MTTGDHVLTATRISQHKKTPSSFVQLLQHFREGKQVGCASVPDKMASQTLLFFGVSILALMFSLFEETPVQPSWQPR